MGFKTEWVSAAMTPELKMALEREARRLCRARSVVIRAYIEHGLKTTAELAKREAITFVDENDPKWVV